MPEGCGIFLNGALETGDSFFVVEAISLDQTLVKPSLSWVASGTN
jgi:hypothetical protein